MVFVIFIDDCDYRYDKKNMTNNHHHHQPPSTSFFTTLPSIIMIHDDKKEMREEEWSGLGCFKRDKKERDCHFINFNYFPQKIKNYLLTKKMNLLEIQCDTRVFHEKCYFPNYHFVINIFENNLMNTLKFFKISCI